jgi:hypothetical protein
MDLLGRNRMKTFRIKILASITDDADKESENITPVVISVPIAANDKKEAEQIFATTFSHMVALVKEMEQKEIYSRMKEMTKALEPQAVSQEQYRKYKWEEAKEKYEYSIDGGEPYSKKTGRGNYGPDHF